MVKSRKQGKRPKSQRQVAKVSFWEAAAFPVMMEAAFKYTQLFNQLEAAVGAGTQQVFNLNSMFDPDATGVGHQPLYYDQLLTVNGPYQRFRVTRAKLRITVTNISANPVVFGTYLQSGPVDYPSRELLCEKPMSKRVFLPQSGGGPVTRTLTYDVPIEKVFGISRERLLADDVYTGIYNANPSQLALCIIMTYAQPGAGVVAQTSVAYECEFIAQLFGRPACPGS